MTSGSSPVRAWLWRARIYTRGIAQHGQRTWRTVYQIGYGRTADEARQDAMARVTARASYFDAGAKVEDGGLVDGPFIVAEACLPSSAVSMSVQDGGLVEESADD